MKDFWRELLKKAHNLALLLLCVNVKIQQVMLRQF
jgi:hypothetical protein